ncbi:M6 family metalloprotease domain-containing protein [Streptomyces otsuchiensis]|uniref:M6 family metalloprotease domain-containing protein n=1 Tax=Streptomyces otsuchiensis TaxID=2681388 RepID=UPI001300AF3E|nr:M6 family metalloprotease domain-containing protein [Streptomyces otsuchiensis]
MPQIPGRRAAFAVGGSLALALSQSPGMAAALPSAPTVALGAQTPAEACAVPGGVPGLHSGIPTPEGYAPTSGEISALTLFIDFPGAEAEISTAERFAEFFPATTDYFADSSYGRLDYRPAPVHGWLRMPQPFEEYGIDRGVGWHPADEQGYNRLMRDIVDALADAAAESTADDESTANDESTADDETATHRATEADDTPSAGTGTDPAPERNGTPTRDVTGSSAPAAPPELTPADVDFSGHDLVNILAAPNAGPSAVEKVLSVSFPGRPLIPTPSGPLHNISFIWSSQPGDTPHRVLVHENGHGFGLPDLYWTGAGLAPELTGHWDVMEQDWGPSNDILAWHKWKMEWLADSQVDCVDGPGTTEHLLTPLGAPHAGTSTGTSTGTGTGTGTEGTRLVAVPLSSSEVLTLEVRTRTELDQAVCRPGVLMALVDTARPSGEGPVRVLDATPDSAGCLALPDPEVTPGLTDAPHVPGETFRDDDAGVEVEVISSDEEGRHQVRVTRW